jgi:hypothetical protein
MNSVHETLLELWMCMSGKSSRVVLRDVMHGGAILRDICLPIDNLRVLEQVKNVFLDSYA